MRITISTGLAVFERKANHLFSNDTKRMVELSHKKLDESFKKVNNLTPNINNQLRARIIRNFRALISGINSNENTFFNSKKKSRLLASLLLTDEELTSIGLMKHIRIIIDVFSKNSTIRLVPYLFNMLLANFNHENSHVLYDYLKNLLDGYNGKSSQFLNIKNNIEYFNPLYGIKLAVKQCAEDNMGITEFISTIGISDSINSNYTSCLFIEFTKHHYLNDTLEEHLENLIDFADNFDHDTVKILFSYLIIYVENENLTKIKNALKSKAVDKVGDPVIESNWFISNTDDYIRDLLDQAKNVLNIWLNEYLLEIFFDKLTFDRDRKKFWLRFTDVIPRIRICVPHHVKLRFSSDDNLSKFLVGRINSLTNGQGDESILLMETKTNLFVESTVKNTAFYSYLLNDENCPDISTMFISKHKLINPSMPTLFNRSGMQILRPRKDGRVSHYRGWEDFFDIWIKSYGGIH